MQVTNPTTMVIAGRRSLRLHDLTPNDNFVIERYCGVYLTGTWRFDNKSEALKKFYELKAKMGRIYIRERNEKRRRRGRPVKI